MKSAQMSAQRLSGGREQEARRPDQGHRQPARRRSTRSRRARRRSRTCRPTATSRCTCSTNWSSRRPKACTCATSGRTGQVVAICRCGAVQRARVGVLRNTLYNSPWLEKARTGGDPGRQRIATAGDGRLYDFSMRVSIKRPPAVAPVAAGAGPGGGFGRQGFLRAQHGQVKQDVNLRNASLMFDQAVGQFRGLNTSEPGQWPLPAEAGVMGRCWRRWWWCWAGSCCCRTRPTSSRPSATRNPGLAKEYRDKLAQAVNLPELRKQKQQVEEYVTQLEKQLPGKAEMDALLTDINQAGIGRNLQFELFRPGLQWRCATTTPSCRSRSASTVGITTSARLHGGHRQPVAHRHAARTCRSAAVGPRGPLQLGRWTPRRAPTAISTQTEWPSSRRSRRGAKK